MMGTVGAWSGVIAGLCVFIFFGFGTESMSMYWGGLQFLGILKTDFPIEKVNAFSKSTSMSITAQLNRWQATSTSTGTTSRAPPSGKPAPLSEPPATQPFDRKSSRGDDEKSFADLEKASVDTTPAAESQSPAELHRLEDII